MTGQASLATQHRKWLAATFIVLELLLAALFLGLLALPMARRAADDLAGLMVLSAQTWAELPPDTRTAFAQELNKSHGLELRARVVYTAAPEWHPPFIYWLEEALKRRLPDSAHLYRELRADQAWYWVNVPVGGGQLAVGLPQSRYDSRPLAVLGIGLAASLVLAWALATWLARRIVAPIERLDAAMAVVSQGGTPLALPETGPRELASLSQHFNAMVHQVQAFLTARTTLLAGISHDLRTPLARLRLSLEIMRDHPSPDLLDRMERDIEQMNRLIGQVLDLARGLEKEPVQTLPLRLFLEELATEFNTDTTPVTVTDRGGMHEPGDFIVAPPVALKRALSNLLQNAQRYAPGQPVELTCEWLTSGWRLGVLDHGPGIPLDKIELMMQPFQRLEPSRSPATGGSGLGLAIVSALANANGWALALSNRPEGGLAAWLRSPARQAPQNT